MSLQTNLTAALQRVANEAKALRTLVNGNLSDLANLSTDANSSLVAAINELHVEVQAAIGGGTTINDGSVSSGGLPGLPRRLPMSWKLSRKRSLDQKFPMCSTPFGRSVTSRPQTKG